MKSTNTPFFLESRKRFSSLSSMLSKGLFLDTPLSEGYILM